MVLGTPPLKNGLLERLPARMRAEVVGRCDEVAVAVGDEIYKQDGPLRYVYFPLNSMFSELTPSSEPPVEAFLTGYEGMVGFIVALDADRAPMHCSVQGSGQALRMRAADFGALVARSKPLREQAFACAYYQLQQTSRN